MREGEVIFLRLACFIPVSEGLSEMILRCLGDDVVPQLKSPRYPRSGYFSELDGRALPVGALREMGWGSLLCELCRRDLAR